jgi:lipopolysaccharide/colanic/teichoic acid biosynthesis glycosyltransferase
MIIRFFDIFLSCIALIILLPIFLPIILILKFSGEGEVFYLQERVGAQGNMFHLIKFATMLKNSSNMNLGTVTIKNDPRILKIGTFLRNSKINELPQLINIIFGNMSLIGPRPLTTIAFNSYSLEVQSLLKTTRPGLSGIGSIIFREEEKILASVDDPKNFHLTIISSYKGQLEKWYIINKNLFIYFQLICLTVIVIFFPSTKLVRKFFKNLPLTPVKLKKYIK